MSDHACYCRTRGSMKSPFGRSPVLLGHMESETIPNTRPEQSGTTGGSRTARQQQAAFDRQAAVAQIPCEHKNIICKMSCLGFLVYLCQDCGEWEFES